MPSIRSALIQVVAVVAAGALYGGAHAAVPPAAAGARVAPAAILADEDAQSLDLRRLAHAPRSQARCREAGLSQAASARKGLGPTRTALGGTQCWWACYPGSGCEYVCHYYPQ